MTGFMKWAIFLFAAAAGTECQDPDHATLLQIRGQDDAKSDLPTPIPGASGDAMMAIINKAFAGLKDKEGSALPPPVKDLNAVKQDWKFCARLDYSSFSGMASAAAQSLRKEVGLTELCQRKDPTCAAFDAALGALQELRSLNVPPKMQNYSLVNWLQQEVGFASWGSTHQVDVDYTSTPPRATTSDAIAGSGYAFCELVVTTMRQSNAQLFSSCGPSAVLSAMIMRSPVEAFRKGLQLYYTGSLPGLPVSPCSYIYDQQPGIMPFAAGQPGFSSFPQGTQYCPGEKTQEEGVVAENWQELPCQATGIQKMWITTLLVSYDNRLRQEAGVTACPEIYTALYPGESEQVAGHTKASHLTTPAFLKYACDVGLADGVLGTCKYLSDGAAKCMAAAPTLSAEVCERVAEGTGITSEALGQIQTAFTTSGDPASMIPIIKAPSEKGFQLATKGNVEGAVPGMLAAFMPKASGSAIDLDKVCAAKSAMLFVFTDGLNLFGKNVPDASRICDHWITMATCDGDHLEIWSWGVIFPITKAKLMKNICGAVVQ
eukprot:gb/GFBE01005470.1/.p1 GENE.gb/GFBE01005470.1/~~gb/GFBE01005470.1/.p1  ORF type:complete len:545 (+),score=121.95 gb/GFBE01005470.1/:1-1635(+)